MANLHLLSKTYGKLPSELIRVPNTWAAYQFDMAVLLAGLDFENRAAEDQMGAGKRPSGKKPPKRKDDYQSVKNSGLTRGVRKMQIPESGIW